MADFAVIAENGENIAIISGSEIVIRSRRQALPAHDQREKAREQHCAQDPQVRQPSVSECSADHRVLTTIETVV
jgi:hypothetical protein